MKLEELKCKSVPHKAIIWFQKTWNIVHKLYFLQAFLSFLNFERSSFHLIELHGKKRPVALFKILLLEERKEVTRVWNNMGVST